MKILAIIIIILFSTNVILGIITSNWVAVCGWLMATMYYVLYAIEKEFI